MLEFQTANPAKKGIPEEAVRAFEQQLMLSGVRMHGYLLLDGIDIISEKYWAPYGQTVNHRMYSISKSFTSMAVGLLIGEKKVALTDKICDYFPEKLPPEGPHPWCAEMTIRDMLTMRTCYASTTFKRYGNGDWTESFFRVKPDHVPGTVFSYDTSSSHVLAALVEKLTGKKMLDYLREKAFDRLGFSAEAYMLKDPSGVSQGGSGLMCTLRDLARVAYLCNHYGMYEGEELLPKSYMEQALSYQVPTNLQPTLDEQQGYGYMFWMPRQEGFVMYGMGGQLALCFPQYDFGLMTMADTIGNPAGMQIIYDCFYRTIYPYVAERGCVTPHRTAPEQATCPKTQSARYHFYDNSMGWQWVEFDWERGKLTFQSNNIFREFRFHVGDATANEPATQKFPGTGYACQCTGIWKAGHFLLHCFVTDEEQGHVSMDFAWKGERLSVRMVNTGEPFLAEYNGFGSAV